MSVMGFQGGSVVKNLPANAGVLSLISGVGRFPGERNGYSLQYLCLENSMDRGTSWATVYGVSRVEHDLVTKPLYGFSDTSVLPEV